MNKTAFPPIVNDASRILILGTMPGERSLELQQYYGHRGNHFWKIIFTLLNVPPITDYEEKKRLLLTHHIALWDVLQACSREGSADSNIHNEQANDFDHFFRSHPHITTVFFASGKAEEYYTRYATRRPGITYMRLPSPSGANGWMTIDQKIKEWSAILSYL